MASDSSPFRADSIFVTVTGGIQVSLLVMPQARASVIDGIVDAPDGPTLRMLITESPEKGKANAALIKLLSQEWDISKKNILVACRTKSRHKLLLVEGESSELLSELQRWVKHHLGGD